MKKILFLAWIGLVAAVPVRAAEAVAATAAATETLPRQVASREVTDLLERFVNSLHGFFPSIDQGLFHWIACGILFFAAILLRHIIANIIFHYLKEP